MILCLCKPLSGSSRRRRVWLCWSIDVFGLYRNLPSCRWVLEDCWRSSSSVTCHWHPRCLLQQPDIHVRWAERIGHRCMWSKELQLTRISLCFAGGGYVDNLGNIQHSDLVLHYNVTESKWKPVSKMKSERSSHGFSVIPAKDAAEYCNK